jgi:hypothetical protein
VGHRGGVGRWVPSWRGKDAEGAANGRCAAMAAQRPCRRWGMAGLVPEGETFLVEEAETGGACLENNGRPRREFRPAFAVCETGLNRMSYRAAATGSALGTSSTESPESTLSEGLMWDGLRCPRSAPSACLSST